MSNIQTTFQPAWNEFKDSEQWPMKRFRVVHQVRESAGKKNILRHRGLSFRKVQTQWDINPNSPLFSKLYNTDTAPNE